MNQSSKKDISRLRVDKRDVGLEALRSKHLSSANNVGVLATASGISFTYNKNN